MPQAVTCTVLFADLRGSTALYERMGNAAAASLVTESVRVVCRIVESHGGEIIKTLGDGLMAVCARAVDAVQAAEEVHESLERITDTRIDTRQPALRIQIALAYGEIIRVGGDCFGDAVNVSARLLDHAGDNETLATLQTLEDLTDSVRERFRRLERLHLRGRTEPVEVWRLENRRMNDAMSTMFGDSVPTTVPEGLRLDCDGVARVYTSRNLPIIIGRSHDAAYCIDDTRVSRLHARIEWSAGNFHITDLSSNGTFVRFGRQAEIVTLRRGTCTLHGHGTLCLGVNPEQDEAPQVNFEVLRFEETDPSVPL